MGVCVYPETENVETTPVTVDLQGDHHYEAPPCMDDEIAGKLQGGGQLCAAKCADDGSCSQDFPEDVKNPKPQCALQDQSGGKYCALTCGFRGGDCPSEAICTKGVCAYNSTNAVTTILEKQDTQGDHHYEAPPCQDDEVAARLSGGDGALCAAQCGDDGSCSQDFPEDVQNPKPSCILQDQAGNKYCALTCGFRSDGDCPSGASCTSGVCAYNSDHSTDVNLSELNLQSN